MFNWVSPNGGCLKLAATVTTLHSGNSSNSSALNDNAGPPNKRLRAIVYMNDHSTNAMTEPIVQVMEQYKADVEFTTMVTKDYHEQYAEMTLQDIVETSFDYDFRIVAAHLHQVIYT